MVDKVLKKGWLVEIDSYENDGDYGTTVMVNAESKEELDWIRFVLPHFKYGGKLGNVYDGNDKFFKLVAATLLPETIKAHPGKFVQYVPGEDNAIDWLWSYLDELGLSGMMDDQTTRCVTAFRVYEVPETIVLKEVN